MAYSDGYPQHLSSLLRIRYFYQV